jgi:hypothetical protein
MGEGSIAHSPATLAYKFCLRTLFRVQLQAPPLCKITHSVINRTGRREKSNCNGVVDFGFSTRVCEHDSSADGTIRAMSR